ncbi:hypothetical protein [Ferrovibrio xuzhouensis]|uniref:VWFA domain-containing protein n=1 Tax=Ferrovibrio xuzhouensis TaxID=1576914 RepID=A0ABV7VPH9_9PROT
MPDARSMCLVAGKLVGIAYLGLMAAGSAFAGQRDMIPSCYDKLTLEKPKGGLKREVFVLIDQTTAVDDERKASLTEDVVKKFTGGTAITVMTFSAFISNHYASLQFSGVLDRAPTQDERDDLPKRKLRDLDRCLTEQAQYGRMYVTKVMTEGFGNPNQDIARSDIFSTLKDVSVNVVKISPASQKDVLLISDMLENSSITSFYAKNAVRRVDPTAELAKVDGFGDFGGASIYVAGAGTISVSGKKQIETYRDPKTMDALETFWQSYFAKSSGNLIIFGKPALMGRF